MIERFPLWRPWQHRQLFDLLAHETGDAHGDPNIIGLVVELEPHKNLIDATITERIPRPHDD